MATNFKPMRTLSNIFFILAPDRPTQGKSRISRDRLELKPGLFLQFSRWFLDFVYFGETWVPVSVLRRGIRFHCESLLSGATATPSQSATLQIDAREMFFHDSFSDFWVWCLSCGSDCFLCVGLASTSDKQNPRKTLVISNLPLNYSPPVEFTNKLRATGHVNPVMKKAKVI